MFATGGADKKIKLLDAKTGNLLQTLSGALQTITSVSFNSTDEMILGSCTDNATRIWSLSTHRLRVKSSCEKGAGLLWCHSNFLFLLLAYIDGTYWESVCS